MDAVNLLAAIAPLPRRNRGVLVVHTRNSIDRLQDHPAVRDERHEETQHCA